MYEVTNNTINYMINDNRVAYILFDEGNDYIVGSHIFVDPEQRGKGYAGNLIEYFVQFAVDKDKKIMPTCPVIKRSLESNYPEILR